METDLPDILETSPTQRVSPRWCSDYETRGCRHVLRGDGGGLGVIVVFIRKDHILRCFSENPAVCINRPLIVTPIKMRLEIPGL